MAFRQILLAGFIILGLCGPSTAKEQKLPTNRSVCLLKSPHGSGSGFFANVENQDVLITNNHVILEMPDVKILDINGKSYEYSKIYSSPDRDLAIIPLNRTNHQTNPNLPIMKQPDFLPDNAAVTAYGDSLGEGVIVAAKGKYLGIGPKVIEVDTPFVSGNSGGPILENKTKQVIGAATYCRIMPTTQKTAHGSRFEAPKYRPAIRRFATRIDNISLKDFEELTLEKLRQDQKTGLELNQTFEKITQTLEKNQPLGKTISQLVTILENWSGEMPAQWHSTYLKNEAQKKWQLINHFQNTFFTELKSIGFKTIDPQIRQVWEKNLSEFIFKKTSPVTRHCVFCKEAGKVVKPAERHNARKLQPTEYQACPLCQGAGTNILRHAKDYAELPTKFSQELAQIIQPEKQTFGGYRVGVNQPMKVRGTKIQNCRYGIFTVYRIPEPRREIRLWFIGSELMRVDIIQSAAEPRHTLIGNNSPLQHAEIRTIPVNKFNRNDTPDSKNKNAVTEYLRKAAAADSQDPFGFFYTEKSRTPKDFIQISMIHKNFDDCQKLIRIQKGSVLNID